MSRYWRLGLLALFCSIFTFAKVEQTQDFAQERARQVRHVAYTLHFDVGPDSPTYTGRSEIQFELTSNEKPLVVDFVGQSVDKIELDGRAFTSFTYEDGLITIPAGTLEPGQLTLNIIYTGLYGTTGVGLHRYVDPADKLTYLFTDFEPQDAHRAFPCFDQPDLKATYKASVAAPPDWAVITNTLALDTVLKDGKRLSTFKRSKRFSTYLFHLSAGPYASFHDPYFRYPLGLYCRQSLAKYLDAEKLFDSTRKGFDFFEAYFDYPYPFEKYDQIFCPDYNTGAMENVAAVTWNESNIFRIPPTQSALLSRDTTLFHEMAHQWFGNLVTMKWWDDLWLNESFATYMGHLGADAIGYEKAWHNARWWRQSAISKDRKSTTHPVLAEVPDITTADSIFDSITYGKGFCVLRQLDFQLGGTAFRDGLRLYFRKNAWKNTVLRDFTSALEESSGQPLEEWMQSWLGTTGINTAQVDVTIKDGKIATAKLIQMPSARNGLLRKHAINLGLFYKGDDGVTRQEKTIRVTFSKAETALPELVGLPAPAFILPNVDQKDYLLAALDQRSLAWLKTELHSIEDPLLRVELWGILSRMVGDGQWDPKDLMEMVLRSLEKEQDSDVISRMSSLCRMGIESYFPNDRVAREYAEKMFDVARKKVAMQPGSDVQRTWFGLLLSAADAAKNLDFIHDLYSRKVEIEGLPLPAQYRWPLLAALVDQGYAITKEDIEEMHASDQTRSGKEWKLHVEAAWPSAEAKAAAWKKILTGDGSYQELYQVGMGFFSENQPKIMAPYFDQYFQVLGQLDGNADWDVVSGFARILWPTFDEDRVLEATRDFMKKSRLTQPLHNLLQELLEAEERKRNIRANWGKGDKVKPTRTA